MTVGDSRKERPASLTESRNPRTIFIDRLGTRDLVRLMIQEDKAVSTAIEAVAEPVRQAVDLVVEAFRKGGRLVYVGAGTSGRLGVLDASECPPTFGVDPGQVVALIAGGTNAVTHAAEGAEDDRQAAPRDLKGIRLAERDVVVGITASGFTPYVVAGLEFASGLGCRTVLLTCNPYGELPRTDVLINPVVGPEIVAGSTRLKSGTACKIVLNMLTTASMIRIGKVYQNLMVDVRATNEKLRKRAARIVSEGGEVLPEQAEECLAKAGGEAKLAIYIARKGGTREEAMAALNAAGGFLYKALGESQD